MKLQVGERIYPSITTEIRQNSDKKRFTFIISARSEDRHGTLIEPSGIQTADFKRNPVVLFNHDYNQVVGRAVGQLEVRDGKLYAQMEFDEEDEFALGVKRKVEKGFLNAASIGFMVKEWTYDEEADVYKVMQSELLEFSIVSVPSNRDALVYSRDMQTLRTELAELKSMIAGKKEETTESLTRDAEDAPAIEADDISDATDPDDTTAQDASATVQPSTDGDETDAEPADQSSGEQTLPEEPEPEPERANPQTQTSHRVTFDQLDSMIKDMVDRRLGRK